MATIQYKRVSSEGQNLDRQDMGPCDKVFEEKVSGKNTKDRPALQALMDYAREGDTVVVYAIDRLARDLRDLQTLVQSLNDKGVSITFHTEGLTFTGNADDAMSRLQLQMMGAFAEFERNISRRRQEEGIAKAKAKGIYKGGRPTIDRVQVHALASDGQGPTKIAKILGVSRMSVHRILKATA
jgi:DNA invertase Pin-like site-specific DNA recombinase